MATYPGGIISYTSKVDGVDDVMASHVNSPQDEIAAIETELGINPRGSAADVKTRLAQALSGSGYLKFATATELTIASDAVTKTQNWHSIDTQADAASDDLSTINGGAEGDVLYIRPENDARTVVVKHNVGNIKCAGNADITLDDIQDICILIYNATTSNWYALGISAASLTAAGIVELATAAEINTGTDTTRTMPVNEFVASKRNLKHIEVRVLDPATNVSVLATVGGDFRLPTITGTIVDVGAYVDTAGVTGNMTVDIHLGGITIMTTNKITLATAQKSSDDGGATQPALTTTAYTANGIFTFDVDAIQTTPAKGLVVWLDIREA